MTQVESRGFREFERFLRRLPREAAKRGQAVVVANLLDARDAMVERSDFRPESKRRIRFAIKVDPRKRITPAKIADIRGSVFTNWRGYGDTPAQGVAAQIEKRVGVSTVRPKSKEFLAIPIGALRTPTGRPKRKGGEQVQVRDVKNTHVIRTTAGRLYVIQRRGRGASSRSRFNAGLNRRRGQSERVVGMLVKRAKVKRSLDFFGAFESLAGKRSDRYDRLLRDVLK